jgi:HAE1 family hydrophobic/amphiphilic exporter-1
VGTIAGVKTNTILTATAAMRSAAEYRDVIVAYRNGQPIRIREIANVIDAVENDKTANLFNNERSILAYPVFTHTPKM